MLTASSLPYSLTTFPAILLSQPHPFPCLLFPLLHPPSLPQVFPLSFHTFTLFLLLPFPSLVFPLFHPPSLVSPLLPFSPFFLPLLSHFPLLPQPPYGLPHACSQLPQLYFFFMFFFVFSLSSLLSSLLFSLSPSPGLPIHPYFSALKVKWLMENCEAVQAAMKEGKCLFGTIDYLCVCVRACMCVIVTGVQIVAICINSLTHTLHTSTPSNCHP